MTDQRQPRTSADLQYGIPTTTSLRTGVGILSFLILYYAAPNHISCRTHLTSRFSDHSRALRLP
ncbi:hypothetical protein IQ07DRAFT_587306 [Pyrenochaeta sp. DS3sAY3a]|nr:hypothetical protein IQ07DRAFT_587306 [Pyrenochaeta sp. DS3sAY3a]